MFNVKVLADSIGEHGVRLTTMEWTFPRCILAEVNTHRMLSRNAASSRAIPTEKLIQRVLDDPFIPDFRLNKKGMQAGESLADDDCLMAEWTWLGQRDEAVLAAKELHGLDCHKQYVNRLLEPWMWATIIVSATDWENVWHLRCNPAAEPSFQRIATMARDAMKESEPKLVALCEYHLPMGDDLADLDITRLSKMKICVGRCARVSYLTHDGVRDPDEDIALCNRLAESGHWSPFEHVAKPTVNTNYFGNFRGWEQYRKRFSNENFRSS